MTIKSAIIIPLSQFKGRSGYMVMYIHMLNYVKSLRNYLHSLNIYDIKISEEQNDGTYSLSFFYIILQSMLISICNRYLELKCILIRGRFLKLSSGDVHILTILIILGIYQSVCK